MHITIINDCRDANAAGRQCARASSIIQAPVSFIGVASDLEAAGNLVDTLDALEDREGVILVNVAPRDGAARKWENGTPFSYFGYKNTTVVASFDGLTLSLIKKLGVVNHVTVLDTAATLTHIADAGVLSSTTATYGSHSQFRSFDFVPRVAAFLARGNTLPGTPAPLSDVADAPHAVWWVDNFGNCKTTLLESEVEILQRSGGSYANLAYYTQLKDVPDGSIAIVRGSSGIGTQRFLEIMAQGTSAAARLGVSAGMVL